MYKPLVDHLDRAVPAQHQPDRAEQHHAARDQPALHRGLHGRPQPRVRARAAVARVPDRPARQLLPPVLGRRAASSTPASRRRASCASGCATSRRSTSGRASPSSATTTTARRAGETEEEARARDPRRAAEAVPDRRHLRPARATGSANADGAIDLDARSASSSTLTAAEEADPPRDEGAHAALRGQGRAGHLLLRLRPRRRRRRRAATGERRRRSGLVLRDQGAAGRAALRPRHRARQAALNVWNDLAWDDVAAGPPATSSRSARTAPSHVAGRADRRRGREGSPQRDDDQVAGAGAPDMTAAEWPTSSTRRRCWSRSTRSEMLP